MAMTNEKLLIGQTLLLQQRQRNVVLHVHRFVDRSDVHNHLLHPHRHHHHHQVMGQLMVLVITVINSIRLT